MIRELKIDNNNFQVEIFQKTSNSADSVKIIMPMFLMTDHSTSVAKATVKSLLKIKSKKSYEIWVVDNSSPKKNLEWFLNHDKVNLICNYTIPIQRIKKEKPVQGFLFNFYFGNFKKKLQMKDGSYANAIGNEIALRAINNNTKYIFTLQSDTLITKQNFLDFMLSKLNNNTVAVGVREDDTRVNALHNSGIFFDYDIYKKVNANFFDNLRQRTSKNMPAYDVGDLLTILFKKNGYKTYTCKNSYNSPALVQNIQEKENYFKDLKVDHCFDDDNNVIFLHLGRGTPKTTGNYKGNIKTSIEQWIDFAENKILNN